MKKHHRGAMDGSGSGYICKQVLAGISHANKALRGRGCHRIKMQQSLDITFLKKFHTKIVEDGRDHRNHLS